MTDRKMEPGVTTLLLYVVTVKPGKFAGTCALAAVANRAFPITAIKVTKRIVLLFTKSCLF